MSADNKPRLGQRLFAHGGVYAFAQFANQGVGIVLLPLYAHLLTSAEFGTISLLGMMIPFMSLFFTQGMQSAWFRLRQDEDTRDGLHRFETTVVWYLFGTVCLGTAALFGFGDALARIATPGVDFIPLGALTVVVAGATVFSGLYLSKAQADQKPVRYAVFSFGKTVLDLSAVIALVAGLRLGVMGKIGADAIVGLCFTLIAIVLIKPGGPRLFSSTVLKRCLAYGLPLVPHSLNSILHALAGRYLITKYLGLATTGVYSMGWSIANIGQVLTVSMSQAYSPMFIREVIASRKLTGEDREAEANRILADIGNVALLMVVAVICMALLLTGFAREALMILATDAYSESWRVTALVAGATVAYAYYVVFSQALYFTARGVRFAPVVSGAAVVVNVAINIALLPRIGFIGSAVALLAANATMAVASFFLGRSVVRIPLRPGRWLGVFVTGFAGLSSLYCLDDGIGNIAIRLVAKTAIVVVAVVLSMRCARVSIHDILDFMRKITDRMKKDRRLAAPSNQELDG